MAGVGKYLDSNGKVGTTRDGRVSPEREREIKENLICSTTDLPEEFIRGLKLVTAMGAEKHGMNSFLGKDNLSMKKDNNHAAINRHEAKAYAGNPIDDESGLLHYYHIAWRALAAATRIERGIDE